MFSPITVCLNCATDTTGAKMYGRQFCGRPCWTLWKRRPAHVLHRCNNGHLGCVRPSHLYLGSASQNMIDKIAAGRDPRAWLNAEQVREIREALKKPYHGIQQDLARQYGVPHGCISKLHVGKIYAWVK